MLTGVPMYDFLEKLTDIVLPRSKEFEPFSARAGDGNGNIAMGFGPNILGLFPEIEGVYDMYTKMFGFEVVLETTARRNREARLMLSGLGLLFKGRKPRPQSMLENQKKGKLESMEEGEEGEEEEEDVLEMEMKEQPPSQQEVVTG